VKPIAAREKIRRPPAPARLVTGPSPTGL